MKIYELRANEQKFYYTHTHIHTHTPTFFLQASFHHHSSKTTLRKTNTSVEEQQQDPVQHLGQHCYFFQRSIFNNKPKLLIEKSYIALVTFGYFLPNTKTVSLRPHTHTLFQDTQYTHTLFPHIGFPIQVTQSPPQ